MADTQTIHGLDDVLRRLKALPPEIVSKRGGPVKAALRKGGKVILDQAVANLHASADASDTYDNTGLLPKSVALGRDPRPQQSGASERYRIFVRRKKYDDGTPVVAAARWKELGTERMQARPWLLPAFMSRRQEALNTVVSELTRGIDRIVRKLSRGQ